MSKGQVLKEDIHTRSSVSLDLFGSKASRGGFDWRKHIQMVEDKRIGSVLECIPWLVYSLNKLMAYLECESLYDDWNTTNVQLWSNQAKV